MSASGIDFLIASLIAHHSRVVKGAHGNPMSRMEVDEKCIDLLAPILGKRRGRTLLNAVWNLEKMRDMRALRPLLQA